MQTEVDLIKRCLALAIAGEPMPTMRDGSMGIAIASVMTVITSDALSASQRNASPQ